jgi:hypothetical protein
MQIVAAIKALKNRKGSSVQAIKKYILANNKGVSPSRLKVSMRLALAKGLASGVLARPKSSAAAIGATGSFKLGKAAPKKKKKAKKSKAKKPKAKKAKSKKAKAKKPKKAKKTKKSSKKTAKKSTKKPKAKKSPKKKKSPSKKAAKKRSPKKSKKSKK